jgi:hypothetical protein
VGFWRCGAISKTLTRKKSDRRFWVNLPCTPKP